MQQQLKITAKNIKAKEMSIGKQRVEVTVTGLPLCVVY